MSWKVPVIQVLKQIEIPFKPEQLENSVPIQYIYIQLCHCCLLNMSNLHICIEYIALFSHRTYGTPVAETMAHGVMELKDSREIDAATERNIQYFLDRFYISRISIRCENAISDNL